MAEGDSPTIARLRVRIAIREAREAAGLTQAQVAEAMEWSHSKVIRIENGDNTISINDLRSLLPFLGVLDKEAIGSLLADARVARMRVRRRAVWWEEPRFRENLTEPLRRFVEYEAEASEIRYFTVFYIPGLLQNPDYSHALTGSLHDQLSPEKIAAVVEARKARHDALADRLGSMRIFLLADESVFRRPIGGSQVFANQLRRLVDLSDAGPLSVRMLPFAFDMAIPNNGSFDLMTVGAGRDQREIMYRENGVHDEVVENRDETARHRNRFEQLWQAALDENDTIEFIKGRIANLEINLSG